MVGYSVLYSILVGESGMRKRIVARFFAPLPPGKISRRMPGSEISACRWRDSVDTKTTMQTTDFVWSNNNVIQDAEPKFYYRV